MRAASVRYLNPLRLLPFGGNNNNANTYDPLPGYERQNGNINGNPPPYKNNRLQGMTQRYRILRSPTRIILVIVIIAGIVGVIGNGGYQRHQRHQAEAHRHEQQPMQPPPEQTEEQQRAEKEALMEHWQPFPRYESSRLVFRFALTTFLADSMASTMV